MSDQNPPPPDSTANPTDRPALDRSLELVRFLRANCEWDAAQTPESLTRHLLEEAHEVANAIHGGNANDGRKADSGENFDSDGSAPTLCEELGDLLLNVAFQIVIAEERGQFGAEEVAATLEEKMKRRHPHLYGLGLPEAWETLKARERTPDESALAGVPVGFDPLHKAYRLQELASGVGFDWPDAKPALAKVEEEAREVGAALESDAGLPEELGDLLFAVINVVRLAGLQPGTVLERANRKFDRRFRRVEKLARARGRPLPGPSLEELDGYWDQAKEEEVQ